MKSIRIRNLRCLKDTGDVELKPITMLVGANSSGKSTFLRTFPLFKQGTTVNKQGPILWYGPEVDFGSYNEALCKGSKGMAFSFNWDRLELETYYKLSIKTESLSNVRCNIKIEERDDDAYVQECNIELFDNLKIEISFLKTKTNISVNNRKLVSELEPSVNYRYSARAILPIVSIIFPNEANFFNPIPFDYIKESLGKIPQFKSIFKRNIKEESFFPKLSTQSNMLKEVCDHYDIEYDESILDDSNWHSFSDIVTYANLQSITDAIERTLEHEFSTVHYIKPFRTSAERYYRQQNLAVRDLDSDGHNMAMFVDNMYKNPLIVESFSAWTCQYFDFKIKPVRQGGHLSLKILDRVSQRTNVKEEDYRNMTDKGFGYSQILPIILTLWQIFSSKSSKGSSENTVYAVYEQPELHLHPKMQAELMDAIIATAKAAIEKGIDVKFIIETHSPVMINRLGLRIAEDNNFRDKASVLLFDEMADKNPSVSYYDNAGYLVNWPLGFFEPELD